MDVWDKHVLQTFPSTVEQRASCFSVTKSNMHVISAHNSQLSTEQILDLHKRESKNRERNNTLQNIDFFSKQKII